MFERAISVDELERVLATGRIIENYPTDKPYPSALWLGFSGDRPLHAVVAESESEQIIVTVYEPNPTQWSPDWKTRIKP